MIDDASYIPGSPIGKGDEAAARGEWIEAVATWEHTLDTPDEGAASQRIHWFLDETDRGAGARARFSRGQVLATGIVLAIVGTACVFLGQSQSGLARNVLSAISWTSYIASAVLVIAYAFVGGESRRPAGAVTSTDLERARARAERLDPSHHRGDHET